MIKRQAQTHSRQIKWDAYRAMILHLRAAYKKPLREIPRRKWPRLPPIPMILITIQHGQSGRPKLANW